jgi:hypothetical protein
MKNLFTALMLAGTITLPAALHAETSPAMNSQAPLTTMPESPISVGSPIDPASNPPAAPLSMTPEPATSPLPVTNKVEIYTGGIGEEEQKKIAEMENNYSLKLVFSGEGGMYLSDVAVKIKDSKGEMLVDDKTKGPIFLANLPEGHYTVDVSYQDHAKTLKESVGKAKKLKTVQVRIPITEAEETQPPPGVVRGFKK